MKVLNFKSALFEYVGMHVRALGHFPSTFEDTFSLTIDHMEKLFDFSNLPFSR